MDISLLCKSFFTIGSAVSIGGVLVPSFRQRIMNYGSRGVQKTEETSKSPKSKPESIFDRVASLQVSHGWFIHFYVLSVLSSIFWAVQFLTHGRAFDLLASHQISKDPGMTINQVALVWCFMTLQGVRRLYESITLAKPSQSKMWVGLWLTGMAYYIFIGISIWIEGTSALTVAEPLTSIREFSKPSMKTFIAVPIFILASGVQHDCHVHLASLKKYTLPEDQPFRTILCPHYTAECFIYLSMAIVAAPRGQVLNGTILSGLGWVVSNLAVTADSTRKWYVEKFGAEKLDGRWRMVPYIY